ncbi:ABC transporter substrate-binding protein [Nocardia sp. IFM 10818]
MTTRRAILRAGVLLPLATACAPNVLLGDRDKVRIAVPWSGFELLAFDAVLARARERAAKLGMRRETQLILLGDDIDTAFSARGASAPEIVMLPQIGRIRELLADKNSPPAIGNELWEDRVGLRYGQHWDHVLRRNGLLGRDEVRYGLPFKSAQKSLIWYDRQTFETHEKSLGAHGLGEPDSWTVADWQTAMTALEPSGVRLLAFGAADGWVVTDLFENLLHAESRSVYTELETGTTQWRWDQPEVRAALRRMGELCAHPAAFPRGLAVALTRQFPDAVRDVFDHRRALMVAAPDFAEPYVHRSLVNSGRNTGIVGILPFPALAPGRQRPLIGAGDVMVLTGEAGADARTLLGELAAPDAATPWIDDIGGFVVPNLRSTHRHSPHMNPVARELDSWSSFDLSDRVGAAGGRWGLRRILTDYLLDIAESGVAGVEVAVDRVIAKLGEFRTGGFP